MESFFRFAFSDEIPIIDINPTKTKIVYISKISLKHVRCFENETIPLGDSHPSLLIAGNNATGKSSILRSIAMGLCDEASAGGLLRELPGDFIRAGQYDATIEIEFTEEDGEKWFIVTILKLYKELNFERVEQKYYKNEVDLRKSGENWQDFPWEKLFIVGYGAGLRTEGTADYDQYFSGDAVYTLFKYSQTLQNPELAWRRLESVAKSNKSRKKINDEISGILHDVLDLDSDSTVQLKPNGIFIVRDHQRKGLESEDKKGVELGSVGDGYRAITTLIIDLLSWQLLMQNKDFEDEKEWKPLSLKEIKGIVIIDEIEKHLHPLLQRQIIEHLHTKFKKIQFIISTHSPLCVSGTADIGEYDAPRYKIFCSYDKDEATSGLDEYEIPRGLRYDQILIDYFRLPSTINRKLQKKVDTMRALLMKEEELDAGEKEELKRLDEELKEDAPLLAEREEDRKNEKETRKLTEQLKAQLIRDGLLDDTD